MATQVILVVKESAPQVKGEVWINGKLGGTFTIQGGLVHASVEYVGEFTGSVGDVTSRIAAAIDAAIADADDLDQIIHDEDTAPKQDSLGRKSDGFKN